MRTREWRRWKSDKKFLKIFLRIKSRDFYRYQRLLGDLRLPVSFKYNRRVSSLETVEVTVTSVEDYYVYASIKAKIERDNPKTCNCAICCNPRRSTWYRGKNKLTRAERANIEYNILEDI